MQEAQWHGSTDSDPEGAVAMTLEPTGWCWGCGRAVRFQALYCGERCRCAYEREQAAQATRVVKRGKRNGYGPTGATS